MERGPLFVSPVIYVSLPLQSRLLQWFSLTPMEANPSVSGGCSEGLSSKFELNTSASLPHPSEPLRERAANLRLPLTVLVR